MRRSSLIPAPVAIRTYSPGCSSEISRAAAQRVPLPEISGSLPSALNRRIVASRSIALALRISIHPSAPMPVWRWQMARAIAGRSEAFTRSVQVSKKSLPAPCAFVKGISILMPPVNFYCGNLFLRDGFDQHAFAPGRRGDWVARWGDRPFFAEEKLGPRNGRHPGRLVAIV